MPAPPTPMPPYNHTTLSPSLKPPPSQSFMPPPLSPPFHAAELTPAGGSALVGGRDDRGMLAIMAGSVMALFLAALLIPYMCRKRRAASNRTPPEVSAASATSMTRSADDVNLPKAGGLKVYDVELNDAALQAQAAANGQGAVSSTPPSRALSTEQNEQAVKIVDKVVRVASLVAGAAF